jgi:predicted RNase H-like HicB family nuclease
MNDVNKVVVPFPPRDDPHREPADASPNLEQLQEGLQTLTEALATKRHITSEREHHLRNFRSARYRLKDDLVITIEERGDQFVTSSVDLDQYGHGFSQEDAIQALCEVIEEYYEVLLEEEGRLSAILESHLRYLRDVLEDRQ